MKYGEYLNAQKLPEWSEHYLNYDQMKKMIKQMEEVHMSAPNDDSKATSLSIPRPTNAAGVPMQSSITQEDFFVFLEQEMKKIELFTKAKVTDIRRILADVERRVGVASFSGGVAAEADNLRVIVEGAGEEFLKLEKFVNLNFMGFHKILKKHDKRLPSNPCRVFYTARLLDQSWVRGDYSDVMVSMSRVYSKLRGDEELEAKEDEKQNFVRSTRKYWVHTEDISAVKYIVLQHLPVFLQKAMDGDTDSQLVNSVYLDNYAMELYHGRLEKSPGAIALRMRWYGGGNPDTVFVERKTHRESWAGEISVKERFIVKEPQVLPLLKGQFDVEGEMIRLRAKGKSEEDVAEWEELASEVVQAINSKQLVPTMRTQYMRTAFQIPFDATVRVSLDTNLCMISERTKETLNGERWFRDPNVKVPLTEITRFPHGVLEIKLQLEDETKTPQWVADLIHSGKLLEVHKFSKFIHGCAVLMPEDVRAVPYWIDDVTLADSIQRSGAAKILETSTGANQYYKHLLPHDESGNAKMKMPVPQRRPVPLIRDEEAHAHHLHEGGNTRWSDSQYYQSCVPHEEDCCEWAMASQANHMTGQKVEPKLFFANERTFMSWLQMAVMMSSISIGVLAFSAKGSKSQDYALFLLPIALLFIAYAVRTYLVRNEKIKSRDAERWDDPFGPVLLTVMLIFALVVQFLYKLVDLAHQA